MDDFPQSWSDGIERDNIDRDEEYDNTNSFSPNPKYLSLSRLNEKTKWFKMGMVFSVISILIALGVVTWFAIKLVDEKSTIKTYFDESIDEKISTYQSENKLVTNENVDEIISSLSTNSGVNSSTSLTILTFLNDTVVNGRLSVSKLNENYVEKKVFNDLIVGRLSENSLDSKYSSQNDFNDLKLIVESGRLSEDALNNLYATKAQLSTLDPRYASASKVRDLQLIIDNGRLSDGSLQNSFVSKNDYESVVVNGRLSDGSLKNSFVSKNDYESEVVNGRLSDGSLKNSFVSKNDYESEVVNGRLSDASINKLLEKEEFFSYFRFLSNSQFTNNEYMHYVPTLTQSNEKLYFSFTYNESSNPIVIDLTNLNFTATLQTTYFYSDDNYIETQYDPLRIGVQVAISYIRIGNSNLISARITKAGVPTQNELEDNFAWKVKGGKYSVYIG